MPNNVPNTMEQESLAVRDIHLSYPLINNNFQPIYLTSNNGEPEYSYEDGVINIELDESYISSFIQMLLTPTLPIQYFNNSNNSSSNNTEYSNNLLLNFSLLSSSDYVIIEDEDNEEKELLNQEEFDTFPLENNDSNCVICLESNNSGVVAKLPCNHYYHKNCIGVWLMEKSCKCPLCKRDMRTFQTEHT